MFGAGKLTAAVDVTASADGAALPVTTGSSVLWRVPWTLVHLLLLVGAVLAIRRWRRRGMTPVPAAVHP
ncbi:hypothetical protein [Actinoplanes couchii]|uniref:hypothetical protein n=1 Tax=Actinoplanes couchii TaxID=403638 RepID=UPI00194197CF|nr:hypothetical protein [Actinoplanes couchii]MDR6320266.1 lysylphosphatidylglycerol synthetase-like protein (DUF2156 family) [Actinoplanes couchii]